MRVQDSAAPVIRTGDVTGWLLERGFTPATWGDGRIWEIAGARWMNRLRRCPERSVLPAPSCWDLGPSHAARWTFVRPSRKMKLEGLGEPDVGQGNDVGISFPKN